MRFLNERKTVRRWLRCCWPKRTVGTRNIAAREGREELQMKYLAAVIASFFLFNLAAVHAKQTKMPSSKPTSAYVRMIAPALEKYTQDRLLGEVWKRPDLSPRDRGIVTIAALIARNQTMQMPFYLNLALDNGVKPPEISEIIT